MAVAEVLKREALHLWIASVSTVVCRVKVFVGDTNLLHGHNLKKSSKDDLTASSDFGFPAQMICMFKQAISLFAAW